MDFCTCTQWCLFVATTSKSRKANQRSENDIAKAAFVNICCRRRKAWASDISDLYDLREYTRMAILEGSFLTIFHVVRLFLAMLLPRPKYKQSCLKDSHECYDNDKWSRWWKPGENAELYKAIQNIFITNSRLIALCRRKQLKYERLKLMKCSSQCKYSSPHLINRDYISDIWNRTFPNLTFASN